MSILADWRWLMAIYIVAFGLWGFLIKIATAKLEWRTAMFHVWVTVFIILSVSCFRAVRFGVNKYYGIAVCAGILAAVGTICFYKALSLAAASRVIPFSTQYILVTVICTVLFLREPVTPRLIAGVACAFASIILLAK